MKRIKLVNSDLFATVDDEDYAKVKRMKWYPLIKPYRVYARANASRQGGKSPKTIMMHWLILGKWSDHIDRDGLNNQKSNLRRCTPSQNSMNKKKQDNSKSKYKGVSYDKDLSLWRARISINGKTECLGRFKLEVDAAKAYDDAAKSMFLQFARTNVMERIL